MIDLPPDSALVADTSRCRLVPITADHAPELFLLLNDQRLHAFIGGMPLGQTELVDRLRRREGRRSADGSEVWIDWALRLVPLGEVIGQLGAVVTDDGRAQLTWLVGPRWQGRGLAIEGATAMVRMLEAHAGVDRIVALIPPGHQAAMRVAGHLHMAATGVRGVAGWERWEGDAAPVHQRIGGSPQSPAAAGEGARPTR